MSVERRLYEAYRAHRGIRLSAEELDTLLRDDAIQTRIVNQAAIDAGGEPPGMCGGFDSDLPWQELGKSFGMF